MQYTVLDKTDETKPAHYLEVFSHDGFPVILNLSEPGPQALHLVLHLHHILEVPLRSKV